MAGQSRPSGPMAGTSTMSSAPSPPKPFAGAAAMRNTVAVLRRELAGYFATPVAYVFIVIFLALTGAFTYYIGNFFERGQADLQAFFLFHPWLYLLLVPAIGMRLWAEERK